MDNSNFDTYHAETQNPTRYQFKSLAQKADDTEASEEITANAEASAGSIAGGAVGSPDKSYLKPYNHDEHAWTPTQEPLQNEKAWDAETKAPTGYQARHGALSQVNDEDHLYRRSAWTDDQMDNSNYNTYHAETQNPTRYQFKSLA
jgi:hypothetical protein